MDGLPPKPSVDSPPRNRKPKRPRVVQDVASQTGNASNLSMEVEQVTVHGSTYSDPIKIITWFMDRRDVRFSTHHLRRKPHRLTINSFFTS